MKKKSKVYGYTLFQILGLSVWVLSGQQAVQAQEVEEATLIEAESEAEVAETVTINVKDANISEVLKAYSLQTGQSIVVGPDVVSENVNVRLNNIPWQEALDVILKPYGFGYRVVGETIVISRLENIVSVEGIEPLGSKVFTLKYLDAYDIKNVIEAQLTARGKISILSTKGLPGWEFGGGGSSSSRAASNLGTSERSKAEPIEKSKTLIVTDVPSSITAIGSILEELDRLPAQVLIESRFVEVGTDALTDIGFDIATGIDGLTTPGVQTANSGDNQWGVEQNDSIVTPAAFDPLSEGLSGANPYNAGLQLLFSRVGGSDFSMLLHALEEDGDAEVLSAPKVLTLDNQEAAILIGEKYPIIESDSSGSGTIGGNVSTSLDYYENIGIQLNVIPQVCDNEFINMIVHPVVSEIDGFVSGVVSTGAAGGGGALTQYPRLKIREAQTQILLKSEDSVIIGGLQSERDKESVFKVPLLGDIPYLGRLFRRETNKKSKIDLLIFIKATIIDREDYAINSAMVNDEWEVRAGRKAAEEDIEMMDEVAEPAMFNEEAAATEEGVEAVEVETSVEDALEELESMDDVDTNMTSEVEELVVEEAIEEMEATEEVVEEMTATEEVVEEMEATEEVVEEMTATEDVEMAVEASAGSESEELVAFVDEMPDAEAEEAAVPSEM